MPDVYTQIVVIRDWWPLAGDEPNHPGLSKRRQKSHGPLQIAARLYGRGYGLISDKTAVKLPGTSEKQSSSFPSVIGISWSLSGSDQDLETSQVRVIPGLEQDLVLGDNREELYQSVHLTPPQTSQDCRLDTREDFANQGIIPKNQQSHDELKRLWNLSRTKTRTPSSHHEAAISEPEEHEPPTATSSEPLHECSSDITSNSGLDGNWILPFDGTPRRKDNSSPRSSYLDSLAAPSGQASWEMSTEASQVVSDTSRVHSPSSWSVIDATSAYTHQSTPEEMTEPAATYQSQQSDFEAHPGHQFWEWDVQRQLWRRRGRSGSDEKDWFTDIFSR
ncbi:hypothetical protein F53441_4552 [Fusarium austroafricanum]|uniref:Uncharacterized protein n=1 Tax=Fusarium austroafricanum TaxID=2364996 RepID=A0A8H4P0K0_9HYPO|nr:hypothetical protein F53441_4552 [Fusarium austroafricanum]